MQLSMLCDSAVFNAGSDIGKRSIRRIAVRCQEHWGRMIIRLMEENMSVIICDNIRAFRKKRGLTQEQLAEKTGIDYKYIQKLEGKQKLPNFKISTIKSFADAFKVAPAKLLESKSARN